MIQKLQKTVNFAARVIVGAKKYEHVTPPRQSAKLVICVEQTEGGNGMFYVQGSKWHGSRQSHSYVSQVAWDKWENRSPA